MKASMMLKSAVLKSLFPLLAGIAGMIPIAAPAQPLGPIAEPATTPTAVPQALQAPLRAALAADPAYRAGLDGAADAPAPWDAWREQKVVADDGGSLDALGWSVAVEGTTALIGAYYATIGANQFQGAVYVFTESDGVWTQTQKLVADDGLGGDNFGTSVALDGDQALIGAAAAQVGGNLLQGAAYVFTRSNGVWSQGQKLVADDGAAVDQFGISVAISGNNALIGAHGATINGNDSQGAVYAFSAVGGVWTQTQKLVADDGAAYDQFGQQFALDGDTVVIGADQATYANDFPGPGAAYVFNLTPGGWTQTQRLQADDGQDAEYFGRWAAIQGSTIVIGAPAATVNGNPFQGAAYVFTDSGGTWSQSAKLLADDGAAGDFLADSVAISGTRVILGAPGATIGGNPFTGAAYLYDGAANLWTQIGKLVPSDGAYGDEFGYSATLRDDGLALIGAPHPTDDGSGSPGAAYFYTDDTIFASGFDTAP